MTAARRLGYSLPVVGDAFDRNHTTVLYAERAIIARAETDPQIPALLDQLVTTATAPPCARRRESDAIAPPATDGEDAWREDVMAADRPAQHTGR